MFLSTALFPYAAEIACLPSSSEHILLRVGCTWLRGRISSVPCRVSAETSGEARRGVRRGGGRLSPAIRTCGVGLNWSVFRLTLIRRLTASVVS